MLEEAAFSRALETRVPAADAADATERRQLSTESEQLSSSRIVSSVVARVSRLAQLVRRHGATAAENGTLGDRG